MIMDNQKIYCVPFTYNGSSEDQCTFTISNKAGNKRGFHVNPQCSKKGK